MCFDFADLDFYFNINFPLFLVISLQRFFEIYFIKSNI
jgi:hypothetical protein